MSEIKTQPKTQTQIKKKTIIHNNVKVEVTLLLFYKNERSVPHWKSWHLLTSKCEQYPTNSHLNFEVLIEDTTDIYDILENHELSIINSISIINNTDDIYNKLHEMGWE